MKGKMITITQNNTVMFQNYPDVVSVDDLTSMLHIGKNTTYKLINDKVIPSVRVGRQHKIPKCYVIEYLQSVTAKSSVKI